jgi:hypothetical protein
MAAAVNRLPHTKRSGDRCISYRAQNAQEAYDVCSIALVLAGAIAKSERL